MPALRWGMWHAGLRGSVGRQRGQICRPLWMLTIELAFMGPEELGVKRRRVDVPKYLCSRDLCGGCCVRVGSSEVLSLYVC